MVGMPGLEPGNPEGADLQSAAVAAVPHPHSLFKHSRARIALTSRKDNRGREKCCQSNPPNRAYLYHNSSTYMRCAGAIHPLARRSTLIVGTCTTLPCRALQTRRLATARETDSTLGDNKSAKSGSSCRRALSLFPCCRRAPSLECHHMPESMSRPLGFDSMGGALIKKRPHESGAFIFHGASDGNRTHNHRITRPVLYH